MAIKMDGHTITALKLKASNGNEVTKQLTEEGTIPTPTETLDINSNGERDVTNYKKVNVNVGGEAPTLIAKEITENGTYNASADNADGYSSVNVNVSGGGGSSGIGLDQFDDAHWMTGYGNGGNVKFPDNVAKTTSQFYPTVGTLSQNNEMTFWLINVEAGKTYRIYTTDNNVSWDWCQMSWFKSLESGLGWIKRDTSTTGTYISEYTVTAPAGAAYMQFGARRMGDNEAYKTIRIEEVT